ncbi:MAG: SRPBCC family protein [Alphaproteobacteria bacterium]|nr:SRPBCC family protein [Alphaproteobacteria bacterium]MBV9419834.1 SRPBCC family protein [Alphaproteobacteria bacterium]MBV9542513.1 SRPBCC family protein [Alphaproteobacteria bacterium]MBV9904977.1 SRPBCC family protein [Alphaproteobacteria bacterium]
MHRLLHATAGFVVAAVLSCPAQAAVNDAAANGFSVTETAHIAAGPDKVYAELIAPSHWWSAAHSYSKDAANFSLDAKAGGCWTEKLPDGGAVCHLTVTFVDPGKSLVLHGGLGPLSGLGIAGALTYELKAANGGTDITMTYNVGGYLKDGLAAFAPPVDHVLGEQLARLKARIETGSPETK